MKMSPNFSQDEVPRGLTEEHWELVKYLRRYYFEFDTVPPVRVIRQHTGFNLPHINKLFPSGLTKGACRIAVLPRITIKPNLPYP